MKRTVTIKNFFVPSAKGLDGAVVGDAVVGDASKRCGLVGDASKRCSQPTVIVGRSALPLGSSKNASKRCAVTLGGVTHYNVTLGGVTHYNVTLRGVTHYVRAAMMMLMMMLTTASAWAFKTETPTNYTVSLVNNNNSWRISDGTQPTAEWYAEAQYSPSTHITYYYWKANVRHNLANGMTIETNADVETSSVTSVDIHTTGSTTFTFRAPNSIAITNVVFMNSGSPVSGTNSASGSTYTVTLANNTTFTGFEVTYRYISGSCGTSATWTLSKQNGQYTKLTISGSGAMKDDYGYDTVDDL